MEYNWGDPKKNSLVSSRRMAKAETIRKKRLTNVKSTLSNQLHPATEHKLRSLFGIRGRKKHSTSFVDETLSSSSELNKVPANPHSEANNDASINLVDPDVFYTLDGRSNLNAHNAGLFHPASTIEAFIEQEDTCFHDIQGASEKSGQDSPSGKKGRFPAQSSGLIDAISGPELKLQPSKNSKSAPASMTSSFSTFSEADGTKQGLSAAQSDSDLNLYALGIVSPLADAKAFNSLKSEGCRHSPVAVSGRVVSELDTNNEMLDDVNELVPPLQLSFAKKFEELKRIVKLNRDKHTFDQKDSDQLDNDVKEDQDEGSQPALSSETICPKTQSKKDKAGSKSCLSGELNTAVNASKGSEAATKRYPPPVARTNLVNSSGSNCVLAHRAAGATTRRMRTDDTSTRHRLKKTLNVRSGISLSDLKAEHLEALKMLDEVGGPVDADYLVEDAESSASYTHQRGKRIPRSKGMKYTAAGFVHRADKTFRQMSSNQEAQAVMSNSPTTADSGLSVVTKLRETISSGRV